MLLPGADPSHALVSAQQCMDSMRREAIAHAASPTTQWLSCSIGVATVHPDTQHTADTLVNAADAAMYRAKTKGRARFEIASQADWEIDDDTPRTNPAPLT